MNVRYKAEVQRKQLEEHTHPNADPMQRSAFLPTGRL